MRANQLLLALPLIGTALSLPSKRFHQDLTDNTPSLVNVAVIYGGSPVQLIHRRSGQDDDMFDDKLEPEDGGDGDNGSMKYRAKVKRDAVSTRSDPIGLGIGSEEDEPLDESADIQSHKRRDMGDDEDIEGDEDEVGEMDKKDLRKRRPGLVPRQDGFGYEGIASGDDVDEQYEYPIERRQDSGDDDEVEESTEGDMQSRSAKERVDYDDAEEDTMSADPAADGDAPVKRNDVFALLENSKGKIFTTSAPLNSRTNMGDLRTGMQSINDILQTLYDGLGVVVDLNRDDDGGQIQADYSSDMAKPGSPRYDAARQLAEIVVSIKLLLSRLNLRQKSNGDMLAPLLRLDTILAKILRGSEELNTGTLPLLGQMLCSMGFVMDSILQKVVEVLSPGMAECLDSYMSLIASGQLVDTAGKLCVVDLAY